MVYQPTGIFDEFLISTKAVTFHEKPKIISQRRKSHWHIDLKDATYYTFLLDHLTDCIIDFVKQKNLKPDCFIGIPERATKISDLLNFKLAKQSGDYKPYSHITPMMRAKEKKHNPPCNKYFIGHPKGKTIVLEDVVKSDNSLIQKINRAFKGYHSEFTIIKAISLVDRLEKIDSDQAGENIQGNSMANALRSIGISYEPMTTAATLLPKAIRALKPNPEIVKKIEQEYEEFGLEPLKLL